MRRAYEDVSLKEIKYANMNGYPLRPIAPPGARNVSRRWIPELQVVRVEYELEDDPRGYLLP